MDKKKKMIFGAVAGVVVVGLAASTLLKPTAQGTTSEDNQYLRTVDLEKEILEETITATGVVFSDNSSTVFSPINNATISSVNVKVGDIVSEGDLLVSLDQGDLSEQIADLNEEIDELKIELDEKYEDAQDQEDEDWGVVYATGGTQDVYEELEAQLNKINSSIQYLQDAYDTEFANYESQLDTINENIEVCEDDYNAKKIAYDQALIDDPTDTNGNHTLLKDEMEKAEQALKAALSETADDTALNAAQTELNNASTSLNQKEVQTQYEQAKQTYETSLSAYNSSATKENEAEDALEDDVTLVAKIEQLQDLQEQVNDYYIKAEISGVVTELNAEVGGTTAMNENLAKIEDANSLQIEVSVSESDVNNVSVGQTAIISSDATDALINGVVAEISPTATKQGDGSTASGFTVGIDVIEENPDLLIGMNAQVDIVLSSSEAEYVVPLSAILTEMDKSYVYVQIDSTIQVEKQESEEVISTEISGFEKVEVTLGKDNGYYVQIFSSELNDKDKILADSTGETVMPNVEDAEGEMQAGGMQIPGVTSGAGGASGMGGAMGGRGN